MLLAVLLCSMPVRAQINAATPPEGAPVYDAVSIKPAKPGNTSWGFTSSDTAFQAENVALRNLLASAYHVRPELITNLPDWSNSARFDINAKVSDTGDAGRHITDEQSRAMLAQILTGRFTVKVHLAPKMMPVYELVVMPGGIKFPVNPPPPSDTASPSHRSRMSIHNYDLTMVAATMRMFAEGLSGQLERRVVDKTGLTAEYDLHLRWTPEDVAMKSGDNGQTDAPPTIWSALKEQLGLKLVPGQGQVDTLVVDHVEMPSAD